MYVAMNRFKVVQGSEEAFEAVWKNRKSTLSEMNGFRDFHLLRGATNEAEGYTLFASHSTWASEARLHRLDAIREFPRGAPQRRQNKPMYLGHPVFEGFTSVDGA